MKVEVKTYATLRKFSPPGTSLGDSFIIDLKGNTVTDLLKQLGIPVKTKLIIMLNSNRITNINHTLKENDLVVLFPQLGGG